MCNVRCVISHFTIKDIQFLNKQEKTFYLSTVSIMYEEKHVELEHFSWNSKLSHLPKFV